MSLQGFQALNRSLEPMRRDANRQVSLRSRVARGASLESVQNHPRRFNKMLIILTYLSRLDALKNHRTDGSDPEKPECHLCNTCLKTRLEPCDSAVFSLCVQVA